MKYKYQPKTKEELKKIIEKEIEKQGYNANLNMIDTSLITDMSGLFAHSSFNGDISKWDVSDVRDMSFMFEDSEFNGDISKWDVSNVNYFNSMFENSKFSGDISDWDVSGAKRASMMFFKSKIPDRVKATIILKLVKNKCKLSNIIEGNNEEIDIIKYILKKFNGNDICYAFKKVDIPYEDIPQNVKNKLLNIDCLFDIYPELHGESLDDLLNI